MIQELNTVIGKFWIEANGVKIPFEVTNQENYLSKRTFNNKYFVKVDFAVSIKPVCTEELNKITTLL